MSIDDLIPRLDLDVSELEFDGKSVALIVHSLALEAQAAAALCDVPHRAVEDYLPFVFRVLDGQFGDLVNCVGVVAPEASGAGGSAIADVTFGFSDVAYRRFACAAQNGAIDAFNGDADV